MIRCPPSRVVVAWLAASPLLVAMASLLGYVPIPHLFEGLLSLMARLVPGDGMSLVRNIVSDVISHKRRHFLTLGVIFTIWTASSGVAALIDALDVVYRVRETRPFWKTRPIALGLTLLAGSLLLVAVGLMVEEKYLVIWFARRFGPSPALLRRRSKARLQPLSAGCLRQLKCSDPS